MGRKKEFIILSTISTGSIFKGEIIETLEVFINQYGKNGNWTFEYKGERFFHGFQGFNFKVILENCKESTVKICEKYGFPDKLILHYKIHGTFQEFTDWVAEYKF